MENYIYVNLTGVNKFTTLYRVVTRVLDKNMENYKIHWRLFDLSIIVLGTVTRW